MNSEAEGKIKELQTKIKAKDKTILDQSVRILDEFLGREIERGESALRRVNTLIALSGAAAAVTLFFGSTITEISYGNLLIFIYLVFSSSVIFLVKTVVYSIRGLRPIQRYQLGPEIVCDIQDKDSEEALRYEAKWKMWEFFQMQPVNTQKLFWLHRAQRSLLFGAISFVAIGVLLFVDKNSPFCIPHLCQYLLGGILVAFSAICDPVLDRLGFWRFK